MKQRNAVLLGALIVSAAAFSLAASSASALTICSLEGAGASCAGAHGNHYTGEIRESLTAGKTATFVSGFITVNCSTSVFSKKITNSETGAGEATGLTLEACSSGLGACTAKSTGLPWSETTTASTAPNGVSTIKNAALEFTCAGETCKYGGAEANSVISGGAPAETKVNKWGISKLSGSSGFCSATATFSAEYKVTVPATLYVT